MEFKPHQGGTFFLVFVVLPVGLLLVLVGLGYINPSDIISNTTANSPQQITYVAPAVTPQSVALTLQAEVASGVLPQGLSVSDLQKGHWYILCDDAGCSRARWMPQQGFFQYLDGVWTDIDGRYVYAMVFESGLQSGTTYAVCKMEGWSNIWWRHSGDQYGTQLEGCMYITYVKITSPYYEFAEADGTPIFFDQVSFNVFPMIRPIIK